MSRIRDDFEGGTWAHERDQYDRVTGQPHWLVAGDEVPTGVVVSSDLLQPETADSGQDGSLSGDPLPADPADSEPTPDLDFEVLDPQEQAQMTVDEVNRWLDDRSPKAAPIVIDQEKAGRKRAGIVKGPHAHL